MLLMPAPIDIGSNDQQYLLSLYEKFKPIMFHTAKKYTSDITIAEDLVQDSIVRLAPQINVLKKLDGCALTAYVVHTVRNTAINYLKRQGVINRHKAQADTDVYPFDPMESKPGPEELLLLLERSRAFYEILNELPEVEQTLLRGKYELELCDRDLASLLGIKQSSVRMSLTRARRHALYLLKEREFFYDQR